MTIRRWLLLLALALAVTAGGWTAMGVREAERAERAQEEAYARRLGDALIRKGIALYQRGDYAAAITAWERYIGMAPPNADTVSIREMINEAKGPHAPPSQPAEGKAGRKGTGGKRPAGAKGTASSDARGGFLLTQIRDPGRVPAVQDLAFGGARCRFQI